MGPNLNCLDGPARCEVEHERTSGFHSLFVLAGCIHDLIIHTSICFEVYHRVGRLYK